MGKMGQVPPIFSRKIENSSVHLSKVKGHFLPPAFQCIDNLRNKKVGSGVT